MHAIYVCCVKLIGFGVLCGMIDTRLCEMRRFFRIFIKDARLRVAFLWSYAFGMGGLCSYRVRGLAYVRVPPRVQEGFGIFGTGTDPEVCSPPSCRLQKIIRRKFE